MYVLPDKKSPLYTVGYVYIVFFNKRKLQVLIRDSKCHLSEMKEALMGSVLLIHMIAVRKLTGFPVTMVRVCVGTYYQVIIT